MQNKLSSYLAEYEHYSKSVREERLSLKNSKTKINNILIAQSICQQAAEIIQAKAHGQISKVVSTCLKTVFLDKAPEFKIKFTKKRGKTEAEMLFVKNGNEISPTEGEGIGVVDIAAFALRSACLVLSRPRRRKALFLDEPFKSVHGDDNRARAAEMIMTVSKDMEIQIILSTGLEWLKIGKVVQLD